MAKQHQALVWVLHGHYAYYGLTGNARALERLPRQVMRARQRWLDRRSQNARMDCDRFNRLLERYPLPGPRVVHSIYRHAAKP